MADTDHAKLYKTQISQTEWLHAIGHKDTEAFRREDNEKRERLKRLQELYGLPFDRPHQFTARQVVDRTPEFRSFLAEHGNELCACRLIPITNHALPKLRMRGLSIQKSLAWLAEQGIDADAYRVDFVPHPARLDWATTFVVNSHGIFGEIVRGSLSQISQGFYEDENVPPARFSWRFEGDIEVMPHDAQAAEHLAKVFEWIHLTDDKIRATVEAEFNATFTHEYLHGYFETTDSPEFGLWFGDYNRILGAMYEDLNPMTSAQSSPAAPSAPPANLLHGQAGSAGVATGVVRIVESPNDADFKDDEILVCRMTTPEYIGLMQRSAAIVTDMGGVLSHAAIVARELKKPCLTATREATTILTTGQRITVNADAGIIYAA